MADEMLSLLLRHRGELYGFIRAILRHTQDAEDLFQEVAAAIMEHARKGTEVRDFRVWAKEIARHQVWQYYRRKRLDKTVALPDEGMLELAGQAFLKHSPPPAELMQETEALRECLRGLTGQGVELLRLRFVSDRSYLDIARHLQRTEAAVRRAAARVRLLLLQCVRGRLHRTVPGT